MSNLLLYISGKPTTTSTAKVIAEGEELAALKALLKDQTFLAEVLKGETDGGTILVVPDKSQLHARPVTQFIVG